jgi:enoyl-CoA hydratase/carnithine racemase
MTDEWISAGWRELDAPTGFRAFTGTRDLAVLMISRPSRHNALTLRMWAALPSLLESFSSARALVLTGDGDSFSAGADIAELQTIYGSPADAADYHAINVAAEQALALMPGPTIAAVRGACVGGGCQLAVACDLRIAADDARFGITPAKLGVVYPAIPTARLARLVGPARAKYLLFTADLIDASTALTFGLVDEVTPSSSLVARTTELATTIGSRSRQTIGAVTAVLAALERNYDLDQAIAPYVELARREPDVTEGLAAFLERRPPRF